jgi:hypothetical protein
MPPAGLVRGRPWKADGYTDRATGPDAVRYASVDTATHRRTVTHADTRRDKKETARLAENSQLAGRFRRWWQVLGSNQRRLSRRFYSPLLLPESPPADQHGRAWRRKSWLPPSAMRPCVPGPAGAESTDGHGRQGWERCGDRLEKRPADRSATGLAADLAFHDACLLSSSPSPPRPDSGFLHLEAVEHFYVARQQLLVFGLRSDDCEAVPGQGQGDAAGVADGGIRL